MGNAEGLGHGGADRDHRGYERPDTAQMRQCRERVLELSASIHAAEAELIGLLEELDKGGGWTGWGVRSLSHWLSLRCGFTRSEARQRATLAERRGDLPTLSGHFEKGRFSVGSMSCAERVATADNEAEVAEVALVATSPQASRTYSAFRQANAERNSRRERSAEGRSIEGAEATAAMDPEEPVGDRSGEWLRTWWDEFEHLRIDGRLAATDGAILNELLETIRSELSISSRSEASQSEPGLNRQSQAAGSGSATSKLEAFTRLLEMAGDAASNAGFRGRWEDRFAVNVTIDLDSLLNGGLGYLADGHGVFAATVRRWLGSASLQAIVTSRGAPLFMGRRIRVATRAQKRALMARDGGCAFPGCGRTDHLHAHHVVSYSARGPTDVDNLVLLCGRHHRQLHQGEFSIDMVDGLPRIRSLGLLRDLPEPVSLDDFRARSGSDPPIDEATARSCEPLTEFALSVLVDSLLLATPQPVAS